MLSSLGRRTERLLYLGFTLILLCFFEFYLSSAAAYFNQTSETAAGFYIKSLEAQQDSLARAFERSKEPNREKELNERSIAAAKIRRELGLPPVAIDYAKNPIEQNYLAMLKRILASYPTSTGEVRGRVANTFNANVGPNEIIAQLRIIRAEEFKQKGVVWGIETPRLFSMQYGNTDYRIPANFLSMALLSALSPVVLAWLGSFYVTRKRELLLIRDLHDFRQSFPHLLNLFPVTFVNLARNMGVHQSRRSVYWERRVGGVVTAVFRSLIVLLFAAPLLICTVLSFYNLSSIFPEINAIFLAFGITIILIYFVLCIQIFLQESVLLYKKDFYA